MSWIAKAAGDGWATFDSPVHGPYETEDEAEKGIKLLYPDHLWHWTIKLHDPDSRSGVKAGWEAAR